MNSGQPSPGAPATIARHGNALYAVNARFTTSPTSTTTYAAVRVDFVAEH